MLRLQIGQLKRQRSAAVAILHQFFSQNDWIEHIYHRLRDTS